MDQIFVPLWPLSDNGYWFLSVAHLTDMANHMSLVAPVGLLGLGTLLRGNRSMSDEHRDVVTVLGLTALMSFLVAFWIDPKLSAVRDWDLISLYGFPLTLWGLSLFHSRWTGLARSPQWIIPLATLVICIPLPHLVLMNSPSIASRRLNTILERDPHYQSSYENGGRAFAWAFTLAQAGLREESVKYFHRSLAGGGNPFPPLAHLGEYYFDQGNYDSAAFYLSSAAELASLPAPALHSLALSNMCLGKHIEAAKYASRAVDLGLDDADIHTLLAVALQTDDRTEDALPHFRRAYTLAPTATSCAMNLGLAHSVQGTHDSAFHYLQCAITEPTDSLIALVACEALVQSAIILGKPSEAQSALENLRQRYPAAPSLEQWTKLVTKMQSEQLKQGADYDSSD